MNAELTFHVFSTPEQAFAIVLNVTTQKSLFSFPYTSHHRNKKMMRQGNL